MRQEPDGEGVGLGEDAVCEEQKSYSMRKILVFLSIYHKEVELELRFMLANHKG